MIIWKLTHGFGHSHLARGAANAGETDIIATAIARATENCIVSS